MPDSQKIQSYQLHFPAHIETSFENFRASVRPMFELSRHDDTTPFEARVSIHVLTDMLLSAATCPGSRFVRSIDEITTSGADDLLVLIYQSGGFSFEVEGHSGYVEALEVAFFDLAKPVRISADAVDNISLIVARRRLEPLLPSVSDAHGLVLRGGVARDLLVTHLRCLNERAGEVLAKESPALGEATLRLVTACLLAERVPLSDQRNHGLVSLAALKIAVEQRLTEHDFGPQHLLDQFGLSRATLYRMFAPLGGVACYIAERRLRYALRVLSDPCVERPRIKQLSYDLGFTHSTAFSRAFRKQFGISPSDVKVGRSYPEAAEALPWGVPEEISLHIR